MTPRLFIHTLCCLLLLGVVVATSFFAWSPYSDEQRHATSAGGFGGRGSGPTHK